MAAPSIASRLARRFTLMSGDAMLVAGLRAALPPDWQMVEARAVSELGGFEEVLQHRFVLLDLDEQAAFDPLAVIDEIRRTLMLNIAIFCFGGTKQQRDAARLARADRCFERSEIVGKMPLFCEQYGW